MATPTLTAINLNEISTAESTSNWTFTSVALDNELFKEGSNAVYGILRNDLATASFDDGTSRTTSGRHLRCWINFAAFSLLDTEANGGMEIYVSDGTNTDYVTAFGSDTYSGGWFNLVIDGAQFTTVTPANVRTWGWRFNRTAAPRQVDNTWIDYFRYMDGYSVTGGTSGDKVTLADIALEDDTTANAYGVVQAFEEIYFGYGEIQIGSGATTTWFEMDGDVLSFADAPVAANFFQFNGAGSGCDMDIVDSTIKAAGSTDANRFVMDMSDTNLTLSLKTSVIQRAAAVTFASGQTVTGNTFNDCGQITHAGATMNGSTIKNYEGTAGTAALIYNVNADPDGEMDDMTFEKGTAATHAMELGTTAPTTITLRNTTSTSYNAADGNNDSFFYVRDRGVDTTYTINVIGGSGNFKVRKERAGDTVNVVIDPVTVSVNVKDQDTQANIPKAAVTIFAGDTVSGLPYEDTVTIVQSAGTATVTHTAHGLSSSQKVLIKGANEAAYNGIKTITVTGVDSYTYSINSGTSSPATGTIDATAVIIDGETDSNGDISDSRTYSVDQDYSGVVQQGTRIPIYEARPVSGQIDSAAGTAINILLSKD